MDWADEHYVKLFTRDTVTWKMWPWQARALLPLMLRKVDNTGFFDVGVREPSRTLAVIVEIPEEVVKPGLEAMVESGTVELVGGKLLLVNYVEAQESRKTDKAKARDYRNRKRDHERANAATALDATVTSRHQPSPVVTAGYPPSSALLVPDPEKKAPRKRDAPPKDEKPPNPQHAPLTRELVGTYEHTFPGTKYPFHKRDPGAVTSLLGKGIPPTIIGAFARALKSNEYPRVRAIHELDTHFVHFVGPAPPGGQQSLIGTGPITATEGSLFEKQG